MFYHPRCFVLFSLFFVVGLSLFGVVSARSEEMSKEGGKSAVESLQIFEENYPRAFFFRRVEGLPYQKGVTYDVWSGMADRLMGIMGKTLTEEVPFASPLNREYFTRFKMEHPRQLVMLHYNGNARDPRYERENFFDGHWLYRNGAEILSDVPAEEGETVITVSTMVFRLTGGRHKRSPDDIALCETDENGRPDWTRCEQVRLVAMDPKAKTITVRRACFGTKPREFKAKKSFASPHMMEGPWGPAHSDRHEMLWFYNLSLDCPKDAEGKNCADILSDELAAKFKPGGELAAFDGLEFDVLFHQRGLPDSKQRIQIDADADGIGDGGFSKGVNRYGLGVLEFARKLREKIGDEKLILADGHLETHQRCLEYFNGIESEGWPHLTDIHVNDWSGGLNRHFYWQKFARKPAFNYVNHKFLDPADRGELSGLAAVPFNIHRLVFAGAVFTDSAICFSLLPPYPPKAPISERLPVWDELRKGSENEIGWLGKPVGPAVRVALESPNLLTNPDIRITVDEVENMVMAVENVPLDGKNLFVTVTARCDPLPEPYPKTMPRLLHAKFGEQKFMSWIGAESFTSYFSFSNDKPKTENAVLELTVEGTTPVTIDRITVRHAADVMYREFERGIVLANPGDESYTFDLEKRFPGKKYRRLQATPLQDTETNNGNAVGNTVTLPAKDALFLVRVP